MRRKISLYIAGFPIDLDEQSFILFNYTMEDLKNPTIVKNSFSQSITLKGTANNNKVFGHIYRFDRQTQYGESKTGIYFDSARKTPFVIYNELNEVLESGYVKLDNIVRKNHVTEYKVTFYGGLGSFLYGLSYSEDGNKKTLADLLYTGSDANGRELNFIVNKDSILNAWKRISGDSSQNPLWDIINFAPVYSGFPSGTFDADKAIVRLADVNLSVPSGYVTNNGYALCSLPKKYTGMEVHDLRSYLQKPVIKVSKIIEAICQGYNNGGYDVVLDSDFFNTDNPYYEKSWMTLPIIENLKVSIKDEQGNVIPNVSGVKTEIPYGGDVAGAYTLNVAVTPKVELPESAQGNNLYLSSYVNNGGVSTEYIGYIEYTFKVFDKDGNVIHSQTTYITSGTHTKIEELNIDNISYFNSNGVWQGKDLEFSFNGQGANSFAIEQRVLGTQPYRLFYNEFGDGAGQTAVAFSSIHDLFRNTYSYKSSGVRSGFEVSKKDLLSTEQTPADFLLSYCKVFGLVIVCDKSRKKIDIMHRSRFYQDSIIDLSERVNDTQEIMINPSLLDSRWYDMAFEHAKSEFVSYYNNAYPISFGLQRIDTGYDFNAEAKELMKGNMFKGVSEVLMRSKYFIRQTYQGKYIPAVFLDNGGTYALNTNTGEQEDFPIPPVPSYISRTWWNTEDKTYDLFPKLQLHESEGKTIEERNSLVFLRGVKNISGIADLSVTDDTTLMLELNDSTPCWILESHASDSSSKVLALPIFSRYIYNENEIVKSLDFGIPKEVQLPNVMFNDNSSIYSQYWQGYLKDRYDADSKVMTCRVNLSGLQVDENLFRNFYFYKGAVWAMNKIINHSLTTLDDTECEFIKVQDKSNYLN